MTTATHIPPEAPSAARRAAERVVRALRNAGHDALFAGGCVRDEVLGREPTDYDVATSAPPDVVRQLFRKTQAVGAAFGVVLVRLDDAVIEVATFRTDGDYTDGRRPDRVVFASAEEDALRRDFTVNGLFLDPIANEVIDHVGGLDDLKHRTLRAIGDPSRRFTEDYLRLLRAARFAARLGFDIDPRTADAVRANAHRLPQVSPERIAGELRRMLVPKTRVAAASHLADLHLLERCLRDLPESIDPARPKIEFRLTNALPATDVPFALALLTLVLDARQIDQQTRGLLDAEFGQVLQRTFRRTLRLSNDELGVVRHVPAELDRLIEAADDDVVRQKRFLAGPHADAAMMLLGALGATDRVFAALHQKLDELRKTQNVAPEPLVTGDDLVAAGVAPGRAIGQALRQTYDEQLSGSVTTKAEALARAIELARSAG